MAQPSPILEPVIALAAWTLVMMIWMYATRLPAMHKARIKNDREAVRGQQMASLPAHVRWKADNYNHLMEMPTIFYAVAISLALLGQGDGAALVLAWVYVGFRVVHSLVQALTNFIELRFVLFVLSAVALIGMTGVGSLSLLS